MKKKIVKLIVTDLGDESVGIFGRRWEVDAPFSSEAYDEQEDLDHFRNAIIDVFKEYADGKLKALYDFEIAEMEKGFEDINHPDYDPTIK